MHKLNTIPNKSKEIKHTQIAMDRSHRRYDYKRRWKTTLKRNGDKLFKSMYHGGKMKY